MLLHQMCAPNSPQWFNTGLNFAYGITGPAQGHFYCDPETRRADQEQGRLLASAAARLLHPVRQRRPGEPRRHHGSLDPRSAPLQIRHGTGSNFSKLRGENEPLSGGGKSSGLMSFLKIGDRAAGAIKSGGTTRRAAKMVCLDLDHPDIEQFINWKVREELKVAAMVEGIKLLPKDQQELAKKLGPEARLRFQRRSLLHRLRPELEQLRPHPQPLLQSRRRRRRLEPDLPHQQESRQDASRPATCGNRSPSPRGAAPTRACNTTTRSTSGTPAPSRGRINASQSLRHRRHPRPHARRHLAAHRPDDPPAQPRRHQSRRPGNSRHRRRVPHRHEGCLRAPHRRRIHAQAHRRSQSLDAHARLGEAQGSDDRRRDPPAQQAGGRAGDRRAAGSASSSCSACSSPTPTATTTPCISTPASPRTKRPSSSRSYVAENWGERMYDDDYVNAVDGRRATDSRRRRRHASPRR